jgi:two-component system, NarL family, nitrate/nitrite response regulator NarL
VEVLVRIILADDHSLMRDILRQYLDLMAADIDIVEADNLPGVLIHCSDKTPPDLILLDLQMPGMNGPASVGEVRKAFPAAPIVVVSGLTQAPVIREAIQAGANGYIPKTTCGKSLVTALKLVLAGETYLPLNLLNESSAPPTATTPTGASGDAGNVFAKLTEREADVLRLLIAGRTNKEIGRTLSLQEVTVKVHLRNVYRKIKAANRAAAVRIAMEQGWR